MIRHSSLLLLFFLVLFLTTACGTPVNNVEQQFHSPLTSACKDAAVENQFLVQWKDGEITTENADSKEDFIKNFLTEHKSEIEFAEHDYKIELDPVDNIQVQTTTADPEDWGQTDTEATWAWQNNIYGEGVIVAVVDTGTDISHPKLQAALYKNSLEVPDGIDNDDNGYIDDVNGWNFYSGGPTFSNRMDHATHVSGIAVADHITASMRGLAPGAKLLPLQFINGDSGSGVVSDAISAISYAVNIAKREDKPLVINASWGGGACSLSLKAKMDEYNSRRVLFATAAGNGDARGVGYDISRSPIYPGSYGLDSMVTVAAHTINNFLTTFSNFGTRVDLSAPGLQIYSLAPKGEYVRMDGTSMATPFVTGAAALLWSSKPAATTAQIRKALFDGVLSGPFNVRLHGKLNIRKAKLALDQM